MKIKKFIMDISTKKIKIWLKIFEINHKNREKNLQFFGVKQSKIRWTDLEIKFIKHENNLSKMESKN